MAKRRLALRDTQRQAGWPTSTQSELCGRASSSDGVRDRKSNGYVQTRRSFVPEISNRHVGRDDPSAPPLTSCTHQSTPLSSRNVTVSGVRGIAGIGEAADVALRDSSADVGWSCPALTAL